jgi:hypothetical protein
MIKIPPLPSFRIGATPLRIPVCLFERRGHHFAAGPEEEETSGVPWRQHRPHAQPPPAPARRADAACAREAARAQQPWTRRTPARRRPQQALLHTHSHRRRAVPEAAPTAPRASRPCRGRRRRWQPPPRRRRRGRARRCCWPACWATFVQRAAAEGRARASRPQPQETWKRARRPTAPPPRLRRSRRSMAASARTSCAARARRRPRRRANPRRVARSRASARRGLCTSKGLHTSPRPLRRLLRANAAPCARVCTCASRAR